MEKYSQFRDKGSGVAPFLPVTTHQSLVSIALRVPLFLFRLPFFVLFATTYFLILNNLPLPAGARKALLWGLMAIPGVWWLDLQLDGVKRGTLAAHSDEKMPHGGDVIAVNFQSPIDAVYLAAVFDPVFTVSYPGILGVRKIGLLGALMMALDPVQTAPPKGATMTDVGTLVTENPGRVICVFPECGSTNGKAVLALSPSLLSTPPDVHIFPVHVRYTPPDVVTPVPGRWLKFLWELLSHPTICVRIRLAESVTNTSAIAVAGPSSMTGRENGEARSRQASVELHPEEQRLLDKVAEALARLGRIRRVGLKIYDKAAFVEAWNRKGR